MLQAERITTLGVHVVPLCLLGTVVDVEKAVNCTPSLQRLLVQNEQHDDEIPVKPVMATKLMIDFTADRRTIDSIFSAVDSSPSVREIEIERKYPGTAERLRLWQWLAVVFFSNSRSKSLESLTLDACELQMEDVDHIRSLVRGQDPLYAIFRSGEAEAAADAQSIRKVVTATEFRLAQPTSSMSRSTARASRFLADEPMENLLVLDASGDWLSVLLPCWGQAWVSRADAAVSTRDESIVSVLLRPERGLTLKGWGDDDKRTVCAFFHVIGRGLRKLNLVNCRFSEAALRTILRECPLLDELELCSGESSCLDVLEHSYRIGHCRARRLILRLRHPDVSGHHVSTFFERLATTTHPLAKRVHSLRFEFSSSTVQCIDALPQTMLRVMRQNPRMNELYVDLRGVQRTEITPYSKNQDEEERNELDQVDLREGLQPFPQHRDPTVAAINDFDGKEALVNLGLDEKVAFLSVFEPIHSAGRDGHEASAICRLDADVLANIFAFAAETRLRFVHIHW